MNNRRSGQWFCEAGPGPRTVENIPMKCGGALAPISKRVERYGPALTAWAGTTGNLKQLWPGRRPTINRDRAKRCAYDDGT